MIEDLLSTFDKGAHFYRCDFQVHSPRDRRWKGQPRVTDEDRAEYAASLIAACRKKGLDAIAITDHHDMAFIPYVRQAAAQETDAEGTPLQARDRIVVFPGIELTLAVPCQAILLLDADFEDIRFEAVLTALTITPAPAGDPKTIETERLDHVESLKVLKSKLDEHNWLKDRYIILPNVSGEGKSSLLRDGMAPKYKDMPCVGGYLDGSKEGLRQGTLNILAGKERAWGHKRIACIQTSDNRREDHADLGNYSSWIKWARPTAEALRQACLAQESRISDTEPSVPSIVITSISVQNSSFLGPLELAFNPQYNAMIGGRGTGKSTILEYLRWALCDQPPVGSDEDNPNYQARRARLIEGTLKHLGATVDVAFIVNGVPHLVRRASKDGTVQIKVGDDELRPCTENEVRTLLPVQAYSQKQLSNVSVRLDELSRFITSPIRTELRQIEIKISEQKEKIRNSYSTRQRQKKIEKYTSRINLEIHSYQEQASKIRSSLGGLSEDDRTLLDLGAQYDSAEQAVDARRQRLQGVSQKIDQLLEMTTGEIRGDLVGLRDEFPQKALLTDLSSEYDALIAEIAKVLHAAKSSIEYSLAERADSKWLDWNSRLEAYRQAYSDAVDRSSAHRDRMDQLKELEAKIASLQKELTRLLGELLSLQKAGEHYQSEREHLHELRTQRDNLINGQCEALTDRSGGVIRSTVRRYSNADEFSEFMRERLSGSGIRKDRIEQIAEAVLDADDPHRSWLGTLEDLETLANFDPDEDSTEQLPETPFLVSAGATKSDCDKIARKLTPDDWLSLSLTEIHSEPYFEYRSREGEYIIFSNASSGQQATALLRTLLNQAGPPLLIDQPEEDLDNPVMQEIVEQIWAAKKRRQLIFVSHNANLVVNGDAELVAWCEYRKAGDQSGGKVAGEGAIDVPDVREAIKRIMEGGEAAFNLRREKYGF